MRRSRRRSASFEGTFELEKKREEVAAVQEKLSQEDIWKEQETLQSLQKRKSELENILHPFEQIEERQRYLEQSIGILDEEEGALFLQEISDAMKDFSHEIEKLELKLFLSGAMDRNNAIVEIHPGAGGTESQDWAQILFRMYTRWAEREGYQTEILDLLYGEEAGIKSVTFTVTGEYAFGMMKGEAGVHRLVRISPFDANSRRHTSFAAVLVYPEIEENIDIQIRDEDMKIDTYRASGAGGQHVNKTSSAVRITHLPTGVVVACQNERSQHKNRDMALKILKARLYDLKQREMDKKMEDIKGDKKEISWGSQIRSYVLHPYRMIKDHRTGVEAGNVDAILDGNINVFLEAHLKTRKDRNPGS